jgi:hypothetical protein
MRFPDPIRVAAGVKVERQVPSAVWRSHLAVYATRRSGDSVVTLPTEPRGRSAQHVCNLARPERFELPTSWFVYGRFSLGKPQQSCPPDGPIAVIYRGLALRP